MTTVWRRAMVYLGLGPDDEYDDYAAHGDDRAAAPEAAIPADAAPALAPAPAGPTAAPAPAATPIPTAVGESVSHSLFHWLCLLIETKVSACFLCR